MTRIFGHYVAAEMIVLWVVETALCATVMNVLMSSRADHATMVPASISALAIGFTAIAIGLYRSESCIQNRRLALNTALAGVLAFPLALVACMAAGIDVRLLAGRHDAFWPLQLLLAWVLLLTASRLVLGVAMRMDLLTRRVLLVGAGPRTADMVGPTRRGFVRVIEAVPATLPATAPGGAIDAAALSAESLRARRIWGVVTCGPIGDLLPPEAVSACRDARVRVLSDAEFLERQVGRLDLAQLPADWIDGADGVPGSRLAAFVRRTGDIVTATLIGLLSLPAMLVTALLIRLESKGPILYRQVRVGLDGVPFTLVKFRSMRTDAERGGPAWASERDPRVTRVGGVIRRCRIDELPQLLNVLRGEMSFIGPRPERPHFVQALSEAIPFYLDRTRVKPGLTGWAQVNYSYTSSIEDTRMKLSYDLYYVKHRSLFLDLLILISTVRVILFQEGAR